MVRAGEETHANLVQVRPIQKQAGKEGTGICVCKDVILEALVHK